MSAGYEKKDVSVKGIALGTVALVLLIIAMVAFVRDYFVFNMEKEITQSILDNPSKELIAIQKSESEQLSNYKIIDSEKGVYQIPIDRAMEIVVKEYTK
jgi:uncharacterized membrane protein required for colicin V production